jgi:hypothetical protein
MLRDRSSQPFSDLGPHSPFLSNRGPQGYINDDSLLKLQGNLLNMLRICYHRQVHTAYFSVTKSINSEIFDTALA